jgi:UPF0271 protein
MGELHPMTGHNFDEEIMPYISSCNVCCGFHSGSLLLSEQTVKMAFKYNVAIGAHPSYNDKENFGRITPIIELETLKKELKQQILSIQKITKNLDLTLNHIKPHGALYNDLAKDKNLSLLFIDIVKEIDSSIKVYGMANSIFEKKCQENNINFISEVFADRAYESSNQLCSRQKKGSVIHSKSKILKQVDTLINGTIIDFNGNHHRVKADTICLHSDTEGAIDLAKLINEHIKSKGVAILPIG